MNFKSHQYLALAFAVGILVGASLHYYFFANIMSKEKEVSFEEGLKQGKDLQSQYMLDCFNRADSICVKQTGIEFYYHIK